jgi:hypothetical protein
VEPSTSANKAIIYQYLYEELKTVMWLVTSVMITSIKVRFDLSYVYYLSFTTPTPHVHSYLKTHTFCSTHTFGILLSWILDHTLAQRDILMKWWWT